MRRVGKGGRARLVVLAGVLMLPGACGRGEPTRVDLVAAFASAHAQADPLVIQFGTPEGRTHLVTGWSRDEAAPEAAARTPPWVWAVGHRSVLEFFLPERRDLWLDFRCGPIVTDGPSPQTIAFTLNGTGGPVVTLEPEERDYRVDFASAATRAGWNRLELAYPYTHVPSAVAPQNRDHRALAVSWTLMRIGGALPRAVPPRVDADGPVLVLPAGTLVSYALKLPADAVLELDELGGADPSAASLVVRVDTDRRGGGVVGSLEPGAGSRTVALRRAGLVRLTLEARAGAAAGTGAEVALRLRRPTIRAAPVTRPQVRKAPVPVRPNVVVYLVDTLRADALGCYGNARGLTPHVDALARDGVVWRAAVAEASWTRASVASLFTGLLAHQHGVSGRADVLPDGIATLAELFRDAGYETSAFVTNGNVAALYGMAQGFETFELIPGTTVPNPDGSVPASATAWLEPLAVHVTDRASAWLDARDPSRPFLLYLHPGDPHSPYTPTTEFATRFGPAEAPADLGMIETIDRLRAGTLRMDAATVAAMRALYDAEVAQNDHELGRLVQELVRRGLYDDTVFVFVADHGEEFHEHGGWEHGTTLYAEVTHVPLVTKLPRADRRAGLVAEGAVQLRDVLPTLAEYAGFRVPDGARGTSLRTRLDGGAGAGPAVASSHLDLDEYRVDRVVEGPWRWVDAAGARELYDSRTDPGEQTNVAASFPVRMQYLATVHAARAAEGPRWTPGTATLTEDVRRNLKALGYVD